MRSDILDGVLDAPGGGGGYQIVPDVLFRASVQMRDTKDYVYAIAGGTVGDLHVSAGMAGDDQVAHSFAGKYEPAAQTIVKGVSSAGQAIGLTAGKVVADRCGLSGRGGPGRCPVHPEHQHQLVRCSPAAGL